MKDPSLCLNYLYLIVFIVFIILMLVKKIRMWVPIILSPLLFGGCQMVNIQQQKLDVALSNETDSILTQDHLSQTSVNILARTGYSEKSCLKNIEQCTSDLRQNTQLYHPQWLSSISEIYLAKALELDDEAGCKGSSLKAFNFQKIDQKQTLNLKQQQCLDQQLYFLDQSVRHAYAYWFADDIALYERRNKFSKRPLQVRDFYNLALTKLVHSYSVRHKPKEVPQSFKIHNNGYDINYSAFSLFSLNSQPIKTFFSAYQLNFSGLNSINRREGFGAEFVVMVDDHLQNSSDKNKYILNPEQYFHDKANPNIHVPAYLPVTLIARPKIPVNAISQLDEILAGQFSIDVMDPTLYDQVMIDNQLLPLASNFSAAYGLWLAEKSWAKSAYLSLVDMVDHGNMPQLHMLSTPHSKKKVLVLIHGLAGSPETWINLTNDIMSDPVLRENYQVWQIFYSTNLSILENRYQIYALLKQAFEKYKVDDAVVMGHSMGGIISRLLVSERDITQTAYAEMNSRQQKRYEHDDLFKLRLNIQALPQINRAVFVASPHRGSDYADLWFTRGMRKIIKTPSSFVNAIRDNVSHDYAELGELIQDFRSQQLLQSGPSDLSRKSLFMRLTQDIQPKSDVKFHSIMGNVIASDAPTKMNDGIVAYQSAYLEHAVSTKVVQGGHSIQENPQAVLELRRILRAHLNHE